jgi:hypothetical protein
MSNYLPKVRKLDGCAGCGSLYSETVTCSCSRECEAPVCTTGQSISPPCTGTVMCEECKCVMLRSHGVLTEHGYMCPEHYESWIDSLPPVTLN